IMVFLAGLAGMSTRKFTEALTTGSVPTAFAFAAIGAWSLTMPSVARREGRRGGVEIREAMANAHTDYTSRSRPGRVRTLARCRLRPDGGGRWPISATR